jgi:hypothetical protein
MEIHTDKPFIIEIFGTRFKILPESWDVPQHILVLKSIKGVKYESFNNGKVLFEYRS